MLENCKNIQPIGRLEDPLFGSILFFEMTRESKAFQKKEDNPQEEQEK